MLPSWQYRKPLIFPPAKYAPNIQLHEDQFPVREIQKLAVIITH